MEQAETTLAEIIIDKSQEEIFDEMKLLLINADYQSKRNLIGIEFLKRTMIYRFLLMLFIHPWSSFIRSTCPEDCWRSFQTMGNRSNETTRKSRTVSNHTFFYHQWSIFVSYSESWRIFRATTQHMAAMVDLCYRCLLWGPFLSIRDESSCLFSNEISLDLTFQLIRSTKTWSIRSPLFLKVQILTLQPNSWLSFPMNH